MSLLFNWGALTPEQRAIQRRIEEEALLQEAMRHRLNQRPIGSDAEFSSPAESGDGGGGGSQSPS